MAGEDDSPESLLKLAQDRSLQGRRSLATAMSDLFAEREALLSEREHALMTDILNKLVSEFETELRQELAERLSDSKSAPRNLVLALANDEIVVARPILLKSGVLQDPELIEIIHHRTLEHQLAIAMRTSVSEVVSDALVETGNTDVIKTLLQNANAKITEATMAYLVEEARRVDSYQEPLVRRQDLDPTLVRQMYWLVSAALRAHLLENFDIDANDLDDQLERVVWTLSTDKKANGEEPAASPAATLAERLDEDDAATPELLIQVLRQGEVALFESLFGRLSGLAAPRLQRVIYEPSGRDLAIACRALEFEKSNFSLVYLLVRRARPGHETVPPRVASRLIKYFERIEAPAAQRVLRQWQRDPNYVDAIERIEEGRDGP
ncbi:MAG: DUF2336 domain-containing protein [Rhodospirillales bacterium]|nr:DUF2336 domain-containing protein [Rhodospirillales bacterium]MDH3792984.1 DUF2336 domain-containing protein [Rhodospirillales bacterium]MDH3913614.1 DUF2336 domain-containing protein [Rhodospirillales bacterium]MDH3918325.1 DUF2336 domain-containing protein [Rhodospirillales bacterium]MDH3967370.1 DUF2336 domain-containing protein [Rhodospirillales bacterium]